MAKEEKNKKIEKKRLIPRWAKITLIVFGSLVILLGIAAIVFFNYVGDVNETMNSVTTAEIESILTPVETKGEPITILVLGRDSRDVENEYGRADTIMLLHFNPEEERGAILSIPRDTLVEIEGHGENKINAAYAFGGEELMLKTVSDFLDADINHYITLDFDGFVKLIDELGGVDVTIDRPLIDPKSGANFSPGNHHLTGEQALSFTRSRSTEFGDIGRIQRQQYVFYQLLDQKLNMQYISDATKIFNIIVDNTKTDLDFINILSYLKDALSLEGENIDSAIIPSHPDWIEDGTVSVQLPDIQESRAMWQRIIAGEPISKYNAVYIDGTEIPDAMALDLMYKFIIKVKNTGSLTWERGGANPVYISYHWLDFATKKTVVFDGERSYLPVDRVGPGEEVDIEVRVMSPGEQGEYILQIDLVHENKTWFSYQGVPPLEQFVAADISYAARYDDMGTTPNYVEPGETFDTQVNVKNNGYLLWTNDETIGRVNLGVHWLNRDTGEVIVWDGDSGELPAYIDHGQDATVDMFITAPDIPGRYTLQYDLVHEGYTWFSESGVIPLEIDIDIGRTIDLGMARTTSVIVYNGNGQPGAAGQFADYLEGKGFKIFSLANAESFDFEKTYIIYRPEDEELAENMMVVLDSYELEQYSEDWQAYDTEADLIVIVGKDMQENIGE